MNYSEFMDTTTWSDPPENVDALMKAMWHIKKGHWNEAHNIVQDDPGTNAAWIHALLHKIEGDNWNAEYWYRRAGVKNPGLPEGEEWDMIVRKLLATKTP